MCLSDGASGNSEASLGVIDHGEHRWQHGGGVEGGLMGPLGYPFHTLYIFSCRSDPSLRRNGGGRRRGVFIPQYPVFNQQPLLDNSVLAISIFPSRKQFTFAM